MFAAGNGGEDDDDCSADGFCTSVNTIAIGSATASGAQADYDESCSCKMAVNFVSGNSSLSVVCATSCFCTYSKCIICFLYTHMTRYFKNLIKK